MQKRKHWLLVYQRGDGLDEVLLGLGPEISEFGWKWSQADPINISLNDKLTNTFALWRLGGKPEATGFGLIKSCYQLSGEEGHYRGEFILDAAARGISIDQDDLQEAYKKINSNSHAVIFSNQTRPGLHPISDDEAAIVEELYYDLHTRKVQSQDKPSKSPSQEDSKKRTKKPQDQQNQTSTSKAISTHLHPDTDAYEDELGRAALAGAVAGKLRRLWEASNSNNIAKGHALVVNLHAPWGGGKTTFVNLLEHELTEWKEDESKTWENTGGAAMRPWHIIRFNAWQYQHVSPPWWCLMEALLRDAKPEDWFTQFKWWWFKVWRYNSEFRKYQFIFLAIFLVLGLILLGSMSGLLEHLPFIKKFDDFFTSIEAYLKSGTVLSLLGFLWKQFSPISAESAAKFVNQSKDPLMRLKALFEKAFDCLGQPVLIVVDDLDRCKTDYVVEVMEGIHTLFNDRRAVFLVAADERWIGSAFEKTFGEQGNRINDRHGTLGAHFLEKIFQLSIRIPDASDLQMSGYLKALLGTKKVEREDITDEDKEAFNKAKNDIAIDVAAIDTIADIIDVQFDPLPIGQAFKPALKQFANQLFARRIGYLELEQNLEHELEDLANYLPANPRFIKRFLNHYSIYLASAQLLGIFDQNAKQRRLQLALGLILWMRWPNAAEFLFKHPDYFKDITENGWTGPEQLDPETLTELKANDLHKLIRAYDLDTNLDKGALELLKPVFV